MAQSDIKYDVSSGNARIEIGIVVKSIIISVQVCQKDVNSDDIELSLMESNNSIADEAQLIEFDDDKMISKFGENGIGTTSDGCFIFKTNIQGGNVLFLDVNVGSATAGELRIIYNT